MNATEKSGSKTRNCKCRHLRLLKRTSTEHGAEKVTCLVHIGRDGYVEKSDHHFIVCLVTPTNGYIRIGVVWIVF